MVHTVNHAAGTEEHQRLEECVRHHVKDADNECADTAGEKHEAKLRHGRVRENFFDVVLRNADRRREDRSERTDQSDHQHHRLRMLKDDVRARQHVKTGGHHRRGMDQR